MVASTLTAHLRRAGPRPWAVPVLLLTLVPLIAGIGLAAIPDANGVIHACYGPDGTLRVIDTESAVPPTCGSTEEPLSWKQKGDQGDPGTPGDDGVSPGASKVRGAGPPAGPGVVSANTKDNVIFIPGVRPGVYMVIAKTNIATGTNKSSACELTTDDGGGEVIFETSIHDPATAATHNLSRLILPRRR